MSIQLYSNQSGILNEFSDSLSKWNRGEWSYESRIKSWFQHIIIFNTSLSFNFKSTLIGVTVRSHYLNGEPLEMARPVTHLSTSISTQETQVWQCVEMALLLLKTEFKQKQIATDSFSETPINGDIHTAFVCYKKIIDNAETQLICACCGLNIRDHQITEIHESESFLQPHIVYFNHCGHHNLKYQICNDCYSSLRFNKLPVISGLNKINTITCADYSQCL